MAGIKLSLSNIRAINAAFKYGQGHIFAGWHQLSDFQKIDLVDQVRSINFQSLRAAYVQAKFVREMGGAHRYQAVEPQEIDEGDAFARAEAGLKDTAFVFFAGGDSRRFVDELLDLLDREKGTYDSAFAARFFAQHPGLQNLSRAELDAEFRKRPGFSKLTYPIGPASGFSATHYAALKLLRVKEVTGEPAPAAFIVGCNNADAMRTFFEQNQNFGLDENASLIVQGKIPLLDEDGKIIMDDISEIAFNPNGTGGSMLAPAEQGLIAKWKDQGKKRVVIVQCDDVAALSSDNIEKWIGMHVESQNQFSLVSFKVEGGKFGKVLRDKDDHMVIVEHVEQPPELRGQPGLVNAAIYIVDIDLYAQLTKQQFAAHLSEPKGVTLADGRETKAAKLELFATDVLGILVQQLQVDPQKIGTFLAEKYPEDPGLDETRPLKTLALALEQRRLMAERAKKIIERKRITIPEGVEVEFFEEGEGVLRYLIYNFHLNGNFKRVDRSFALNPGDRVLLFFKAEQLHAYVLERSA
jgi:hypothetical protein